MDPRVMKERIDENHPWVTDDDIIVTSSTSTMFVFISNDLWPVSVNGDLRHAVYLFKKHIKSTFTMRVYNMTSYVIWRYLTIDVYDETDF